MTRAAPSASWISAVDQAAGAAPAAEEDLLEQILLAKGRWPLELCRRLQNIYREYATAAGVRTLEDCHGWKPEPGDRTRARRLAEAARRAAMVNAYLALADCDGLTVEARCKVLALEMIGFEVNYWPLWRERGLPATGTSQLLAALYRAYAVLPDKPPAKSVRGLRRLLAQIEVT